MIEPSGSPSYLVGVGSLPDDILAAIDAEEALTPAQEKKAREALRKVTKQIRRRRRGHELQTGEPVPDEPPVGTNPQLLELLAGPLRPPRKP